MCDGRREEGENDVINLSDVVTLSNRSLSCLKVKRAFWLQFWCFEEAESRYCIYSTVVHWTRSRQIIIMARTKIAEIVYR